MATTKPDSGVAARHEGTVESVYAGDSGVDRLKPNAIGLWGVIFVGVTGAAPISAMLFNVPFATGFGTGLYTPAAFLFATIILTIFTIGYVAMARKMRAAGGFYTFISHGLGRELGLATRHHRRDRLLAVRGLAARRLRLLRGDQLQRLVRLADPVDRVRAVRGGADQRALLPARRAVGEDPRRRAGQRGHHPRDLRPGGLRQRWQQRRRHPVPVAEHVQADGPGPRASPPASACSWPSGRGSASRRSRTTRRSPRTRRRSSRGRR